MPSAHILVVDDEPDIRALLKEILDEEGYVVEVAASAEAAREARRARRPDLVLLDIWMPGDDGITLLKEWQEEGALNVPVIMMSGHGTVETAVEATRLGAYDFIEKPLSLAKLLVTVQRGLQAFNLSRENAGLRQRSGSLDEPVGRSAAMQALREQVGRIAAHDTPVLVLGEAGSGKGSFARYIHESGPRASGPFIDVGVISLDGDNPAIELFGSEEGEQIHYGLLEQANGGTLFLDDIGDLSDGLQARLLGALESGSYHRIGGTEPVNVELRLIAASHYNLEQRVAEGRFRHDLYYLLNVLPVVIPPLRDHAEDVPELLNFYTDQFVAQDKLPYRSFSVAAQNRLRHYAWPGNVRELRNLVQRLLIVGNSESIEAEEVEAALGAQPQATMGSAIAYELPLRQAREQFERDYFEHILREYDGSVVKAAKHAGVERTHLYRKLRALGIDAKHVGK